MSIENLKTFDPFADADDDQGGEKAHPNEKIHIRIQQRNGRKTLTTISGLNYTESEFKALLKTFKKKFSCNGVLVKDPEHGTVVQLQGDQRKKGFEYLTEYEKGPLLSKDSIQIHGF